MLRSACGVMRMRSTTVPFALPSTLVWRTTIKFNVRAMNPSRLPVSVKDHLDRHAPDRGFRNFENHACLNFGFRCAQFS